MPSETDRTGLFSAAMFLPKVRFFEERAPRWGDEAAEWDWRLEKVWLGMLVTVFVLVAAGVILVAVGDHDAAYACVAGFLLLNLVGFTAVMMFTRRRDCAATRDLGITVNGRPGNFPPKTSPAYERWCETKGVIPYSASDRHEHQRETTKRSRARCT